MLNSYTTFFAASTGASAAFIGLLFVALTVANQSERDDRATAAGGRVALAGTSFALLLDAFFVSIVSLTGDVYFFASVSAAMAVIGLWATGRLLPRLIRMGNWSAASVHRKRNIAFAVASIGTYVFQLVVAALLLANTHSSFLLRLGVIVMLLLYAGALARSWVITQM